MNKSFLGLIIFIGVALISCETDIEANAEYKDIPVVYGLLDVSDSIHYIKINKAFSGNVSALDLAADASNYDYEFGEIDVIVSNGGTDYPLIRVDTVTKDAGIFDNSTNVLYVFKETNLDVNSIYSLRIINNNLNKEITAETAIVGDIDITNPISTNQNLGFFNGSVATGEYLEKTFEIETGENMGRIEAKVIFNYLDVYTIASGKDSVARRVEIRLGQEIIPLSASGVNLEWKLAGETFFENIASAVPPMTSDLSHRRLDNVSLEFQIAGTDLSTFMAVSAPSNTVNQDKPNYTNVTNGIGIFSSRGTTHWYSNVVPLAQNRVNLTPNTVKYLATHSSLFDRGFCEGYFNPSAPGNPNAPCVRQ
jgi:hypothetical protein